MEMTFMLKGYNGGDWGARTISASAFNWMSSIGMLAC